MNDLSKKLKYFINYISKIEYDNIKKNTQFCFIKESFLNFLLFQGRPCGLYCDFSPRMNFHVFMGEILCLTFQVGLDHG